MAKLRCMSCDEIFPPVPLCPHCGLCNYLRPVTKRGLIWKSADGQHTPVNELSNSHLGNAIDLLRRYVTAFKLEHGTLPVRYCIFQYLEAEYAERYGKPPKR